MENVRNGRKSFISKLPARFGLNGLIKTHHERK
jgi:hypothetical protein